MKQLHRRRARAAIVLIALLAAFPLALRADEGFWPFNRIPKAAIKQAYGVDLTDAWLERVQQASVRFPSGSGAFVSGDGLVLTNHHVALDIVQKLSSASRDYVTTGFAARDRAQELKAPDLELVVLQTIADVTPRVNAAIKPGMSTAETLAVRRSEQEREAKDLFFGLENSLKSWSGQLKGLSDPAIMTQKAAAENALRSAVMANPEFKARFGDAWDAIANARRALSSYNMERVMIEGGLALYSDYFAIARTLVRWAAESQRPNGERLPEYTEARRPAIERQIGSAAPIPPGLEKAKLSESLASMRDQLGAHHAVVKLILAGTAPGARAAELVETTMLGDLATRKALFAGGAAALARSTDPFIQLARAIEPLARELRAKYDNELIAVERDAYAKIAQAVFATQGESAYPDGTFTLRLSYGVVKGYSEDGETIAPYTDLRGLYVRADRRGLKPPYKYPETWAKARNTLALDTPYNFVTTNDIVGGNSGSPVINARGELVGLIFDGNIHSLPGYFVYDAAVNRAVSVDVRGMIEALRKVYGAEALASELLAAMATPTAGR
jgi:hypothetical protein